MPYGLTLAGRALAGIAYESVDMTPIGLLSPRFRESGVRRRHHQWPQSRRLGVVLFAGATRLHSLRHDECDDLAVAPRLLGSTRRSNLPSALISACVKRRRG